ncbi:hypothetical protein [Denitratimonas sp. CY0512]|uniref:hypothetical protein n=1 Tax=Denitratimonas sp. CY0512 TaxID=3131940 RepID=UPI0030B5AE89
MLFTVYSRYVPNLTRQDRLAITGLLTRAKAADPEAPTAKNVPGEQGRVLRNEEGAWTPVTCLPTKKSSFDQWMDDLVEI